MGHLYPVEFRLSDLLYRASTLIELNNLLDASIPSAQDFQQITNGGSLVLSILQQREIERNHFHLYWLTNANQFFHDDAHPHGNQLNQQQANISSIGNLTSPQYVLQQGIERPFQTSRSENILENDRRENLGQIHSGIEATEVNVPERVSGTVVCEIQNNTDQINRENTLQYNMENTMENMDQGSTDAGSGCSHTELINFDDKNGGENSSALDQQRSEQLNPQANSGEIQLDSGISIQKSSGKFDMQSMEARQNAAPVNLSKFDMKKFSFLRGRRNTTMHNCSLCEFMGSTKKSLADHVKLDHRKSRRTLYCSKCDYETPFSTHLISHMRHAHFQSDLVKCKFCEYETKHKHLLIKHTEYGHTVQIQDYKCAGCDFLTIYGENFRKHFRWVHEKAYNIFECTLCDFESGYAASMKRHMVSKHDGKNMDIFQCNECPYRDYYKRGLDIHIKSKHTFPTQIFKCKKCVFESNVRSCLRTHMTKEHDAKTYQCKLCSFVSIYASCLKRHVNTKHNDNCYLTCDICAFSTTFIYKMKHHMSEHLKS